MRGRWGLQAKMTASYVLVTAAAVVLVEVVVAGIVLPRLVSRADRATRVQLIASDYADTAMKLGARLGRLPTAGEFKLGEAAQRSEADQTLAVRDGAGAAIPDTTTSTQHQAKVLRPPVVLLLAPDGRVIASSNPARYQVGERLGDPGMGALPTQVRTQPPTAWGKRDGLTPTPTQSGEVLWAAAPVLNLGQASNLQRKPLLTPDLLGMVYVQVPAGAKLAGEPSWLSALGPQLGVGLLVLAAAVPVGVVFGLLSTRRLIGRLRRLAATTVAVADGDYRQRVAVSGGDEVAQLEGNLNRMAQRLGAAMARGAAGAVPRLPRPPGGDRGRRP